MSWRLPSYRSSSHYGGTDCSADHIGSADQPCWGEVHETDEIQDGEGHIWVYACEGHMGYMDGDPYTPSDKVEDQKVGPKEA